MFCLESQFVLHLNNPGLKHCSELSWMGLILVKFRSFHSLNEVFATVKKADTAIWMAHPNSYILLRHFGDWPEASHPRQ